MNERQPLFVSEADRENFSKTLKTTCFGKRLHFFESVDSTNVRAAELAKHDMETCPNGTVFVTDHQHMGKGRMGRTWEATPRTGLLFSLLISECHFPDNRLGWVSLAAGLAAVDAIRKLASRISSLELGIKWPNDIIVPLTQNKKGSDGENVPWKKLGGILCESFIHKSKADDKEKRIAIIGMGINVLQLPTELPKLSKFPPTSITLETGLELDRKPLLAEILFQLERRIGELKTDEGMSVLKSDLNSDLKKLWNEKTLLVDQAGVRKMGMFSGLDDYGSLCLRLPSGKEITLPEAEILAVD